MGIRVVKSLHTRLRLLYVFFLAKKYVMCSTTEVIFAVVGGDTSDTSCGTTVIKKLQSEYIFHLVGLNQLDGGFDIPI